MKKLRPHRAVVSIAKVPPSDLDRFVEPLVRPIRMMPEAAEVTIYCGNEWRRKPELFELCNNLRACGVDAEVIEPKKNGGSTYLQVRNGRTYYGFKTISNFIAGVMFFKTRSEKALIKRLS